MARRSARLSIGRGKLVAETKGLKDDIQRKLTKKLAERP
jgi:hypothetical protein